MWIEAHTRPLIEHLVFISDLSDNVRRQINQTREARLPQEEGRRRWGETAGGLTCAINALRSGERPPVK
jgi:hypothetical protein